MFRLIFISLFLIFSVAFSNPISTTGESIGTTTVESTSSFQCSVDSNDGVAHYVQAIPVLGTWVCIGDCVGPLCCQIVIVPGPVGPNGPIPTEL